MLRRCFRYFAPAAITSAKAVEAHSQSIAEVRSTVLGYRSAKLSPAALKAYCTTYGLDPSGNATELMARCESHVREKSNLFDIFTLGVDIEKPNSNEVVIFHTATKEHKTCRLDEPTSVTEAQGWIQQKGVSLGSCVTPVFMPSYQTPSVEVFRKTMKAQMLTDGMSVCRGILVEHLSRVKHMTLPKNLLDIYAFVAGRTYMEQEPNQSTSLTNAIVCWESVRFSMTKLSSSKLPPEEQILNSCQVALDVVLISVGTTLNAKSQSVFSVKLFNIFTKKVFKAESTVVKEVTQQALQHLGSSTKRTIVLVPCFKTRPQDILQVIRSNNIKTLRIQMVMPCDMVDRLQFSSSDPKECWKKVVEICSNDEGVATTSVLESVAKKIKLQTVRLADVVVPSNSITSQQQFAESRSSLQNSKMNFSAKQEYDAFMSALFSEERLAREKAKLEHYKKYLILDLETTTKKHNKRVASPFCEENFVVLPGLLSYDAKMMIPDNKYTTRSQMVLPPLDEYDVIVGHNLKFDLLYLWNDPELKKFFARGGLVWDTMYAEYLLTGQRVRIGTGAGLNDLAVKYGGTKKLDKVKALWSQGIDTKDIDYSILREYLEGDLRNTELIFKNQLQLAVEGRQAMIINMRMDVVPCTTEMEFNGLKMDTVSSKKQYEELRKKIAKMKSQLYQLIPPEVPSSLKQYFNWNSLPLLGAVFFGGNADVATGKVLGTPSDVTAAVELAVRAGNINAVLRKKYGVLYLKAQGLRTNGRAAEVDARYQAFVTNKTVDNYQFFIAGIENGKPYFYNPETQQRLPIAEGTLDDVFGLEKTNKRAVVVSSTYIESELREALTAMGVHVEEGKTFFCHVDPICSQLTASSTPEEVWSSLLTKASAPSNDTTFEAQVAAVKQVLGSSVGTETDCFATPIAEGMSTIITFPGLVNTYFPNPNERNAFIQKSTTEKGAKSVTSDVMETFAKRKEPIATALVDLRGDQKLLTTYYETDGSGMMALVNNRDSCIHHELVVCQTTTSRMASANPNMQNVPKTDGIRSLFVSRFGEDGLLLEADYSQLEVIVLCALARDPQMTEDLRKNIDFHCKRVTLMRPGELYDDVVRKSKKEKVPEYVELRQKAKVFSFQRQYGAGVEKLSESTGLSVAEIKKLIKTEEEVYWRVKQFYDVVNYSVQQWSPTLQDGTRTAKGEFAYKGEFRIPTGTRFTFGEIERTYEGFDNASPMSYLSTQLKNYPVQGFAGEIVQVMLGRLWRHFVKTENYGGKAFLNNTVHDCVWVDCHKDVMVDVAKDVQRILAEVPQVFNGAFPELDMNVSFGTEVVAGPTMAKMKGVHF
eukprot:PhF_6_TR10619/c0_g1_i1/m.17170/K02335/DPO1, polA; DNA polymerase I